MTKKDRPLRTEEEYAAALKEFEAYFDDEPAPGTKEAERFAALGLKISKYEAQQDPTVMDSPQD